THEAQSRRAVRVNPRLDCGSPDSASIYCSPCCPLRSKLTRRPAPGVLPLGIRARTETFRHLVGAAASPICVCGVLTPHRNKRERRNSESGGNRRLLFVLKNGILSLNLGTDQMSHQPNNIFAGTQVVSLVEVRGTNNSLVHPRGAVGVVTRTPAVEGEKFLVRFPDGFEASLTREQLEVLKHFKDRLGNCSGAVSAPNVSATVTDRRYSDFDLESLVIYRCVVGSRAYGLDNDDSDTDRRGIYLAPADLHWSLFGAPEQLDDNATERCHWELQKFLAMALKANPNILECLYSAMVEKITPLGEELLGMRQQLLAQMICQTFNGY